MENIVFVMSKTSENTEKQALQQSFYLYDRLQQTNGL